MNRVLKNGFSPCAPFQGSLDDIRYEAVRFAADISRQVSANKKVRISKDEGPMTVAELAALAEITIFELAYIQRLYNIGDYLALAYSDEEMQTGTPMAVDSSSEEEEEVCLCRTASCAPQEQSQIGQLAANMLIASGQIKRMIEELCQKLTIESPVVASTISPNYSETDRRRYHERLVNTLFVRFGGGGSLVEVQMIGITVDEVFETLCQISQSVWNLMTLCAMTNAFRFLDRHPTFKTSTIDPNETIFGNGGWKIVEDAATMEFLGSTSQSDDVLSR
jgi:hypothetical protein